MSSNVESTFSYDSASVDVLVISNRPDFFYISTKQIKINLFQISETHMFPYGRWFSKQKFAVYRGMVGN